MNAFYNKHKKFSCATLNGLTEVIMSSDMLIAS